MLEYLLTSKSAAYSDGFRLHIEHYSTVPDRNEFKHM
jgi:hypothetical protein